MKRSQFNYFINDGDRVICFNAISGKMFSVSQPEYDLIEQKLNDSAPSNDSGIHVWLAQNNFIVKDGVDELNTIRLQNRVKVFDNNYQMIINPTQECNFKCWYCYESHSQGRMSEETMGRIKRYVERLAKEKVIKSFHLAWFGGEPLLYFDEVVYPLSMAIKEIMAEHHLPFRNSITTNGFLIDKNRINKFRKIDLNFFQITIDGDAESHNKTRNNRGEPSFAIILNNITTLCEEDSGNKITLRINYTDKIIQKDFGAILSVIPEKVRDQITVNFQRVWQTKTKETKTKDGNNPYLINAIEAVRNLGFNSSIATEYKVSPKQMCYADRFYYSHINYDGRVYKCTARDYKPENQLGELTATGQIHWKPGVLERRYAKANFDNGTCTKCKKLFLCFGKCFQTMEESEAKGKFACFSASREMDVETYIRQSYRDMKKRIENHSNCRS